MIVFYTDWIDLPTLKPIHTKTIGGTFCDTTNHIHFNPQGEPMSPIRAIYCDIEGCILPGKGLPFPLMEINDLCLFLNTHTSTAFGICTGRSIPFVEAITQALNLVNSTFPCVCEGGAVLYWPASDRWEKIAHFPTKDKQNFLDSVQNLAYRQEPGKVVCLSLYPNDSTTVEDLYQTVAQSSASKFYTITKSVAAVDITPAGINKSSGVSEVCCRLGISLEEILYIGDAQNDLNLLKLAGYSGCPQNASAEIKSAAAFVADQPSTLGVLEILHHFEAEFQKYP